MDPREVGAVVAFVLFVLVTGLVAIGWPTRCGTLQRRLSLIVLWQFAALRLYSATSFIWAVEIDDGMLSVARYLVFAWETSMAIIVGGILWFYIRREGK